MLYFYYRQITQCDVYNSDVIYEAFHLCLNISLVRTAQEEFFANVFAKQEVYIEQLISDADSVSGLSMLFEQVAYTALQQKNRNEVFDFHNVC